MFKETPAAVINVICVSLALSIPLICHNSIIINYHKLSITVKFTYTCKTLKDCKILGSPTKEVEKYIEDEKYQKVEKRTVVERRVSFKQRQEDQITPVNKVVVSKKKTNK